MFIIVEFKRFTVCRSTSPPRHLVDVWWFYPIKYNVDSRQCLSRRLMFGVFCSMPQRYRKWKKASFDTTILNNLHPFRHVKWRKNFVSFRISEYLMKEYIYLYYTVMIAFYVFRVDPSVIFLYTLSGRIIFYTDKEQLVGLF
jgi:hypothetical protein